MDRNLSIYLDGLRFIAALWVAVSHLGYSGVITPELAGFLPHSGRDAVVIFFVLSGFVIAYVATVRETTAVAFCAARAARIYSVVIPILCLTLILDFCGRELSHEIYAPFEYQYFQLYKYVPFHLAFMGEHWFMMDRPFTLEPYWSLSYEVWYYVLFFVFAYFKGWRRLLFITAGLVVIGHKLWLLLPVWASGVVLYRFHERFPISPRLARSVVVGTVVIYLSYASFGWREIMIDAGQRLVGAGPNDPLGSAREYLSDYCVGVLVCLNI